MAQESQLNTRVPLELKKEIKKIALREDTTVEEIVIKTLEEYVKVHGEGNPVYALDKWVEESHFKAVPALFSNTQTWIDYLSKCTEKEREEIQDHISGLQNQFRKRGF